MPVSAKTVARFRLSIVQRLTVSDTDNANLASATLTLNNRPDGANEILAVTPSGAIVAGNIAYANGVLTITANAPLADYQNVLRSATYNNLSQNPDTTARTINFVVSDGTANSVAAVSTVQVTCGERCAQFHDWRQSKRQ